MTRNAKPLVLLPACNRSLGVHPFHVAGKKYADAVRLAGAVPLILPNAEADEIDATLDEVDGLLLTGSPSNVFPGRFGQDVLDHSLPLDIERDSTVFHLIPAALERGLPLLAICRGLQEVNVAFGGALHQAVHRIPSCDDHREDVGAPPDQQYAPAHEVAIQPGGMPDGLLGQTTFQVNSLHGQAVSRLGAGLRVEAVAPDGVIEAFSVACSRGFSLCVQWHPEWRAADNEVSLRLFHAFGAACRTYREHRLRGRFAGPVATAGAGPDRQPAGTKESIESDSCGRISLSPDSKAGG